MTSPAASAAPKRLRILDDEEIDALYGTVATDWAVAESRAALIQI